LDQLPTTIAHSAWKRREIYKVLIDERYLWWTARLATYCCFEASCAGYTENYPFHFQLRVE